MSKLLTGLANQLRGIDFPDDDGFFDREFFSRVEAHGSKGCYPMPNGNLWVVKFSICGTICVIGFTAHAADAARFSDMAKVRFHPFRKRGGWKPLTDADLNFDLAQVKSDEMEVQEAVALLDDIQHLLLANGTIVDRKVVEANHEAAVQVAEAKLKIRQARKTKGGQILERVNALEESNAKIQESNLRIETLLAQFVALNKV